MPLDLGLVGQRGEPSTFTYGWKDVALYALGVGAKVSELDYLFEGRGPKVLPSFAVVPAFRPMFDLLARAGGNLAMVVHGTQRVEIHRPLPPEATVLTTAKVKAVYDMRRFANVLVEAETTDGAGGALATTTWTLIVRGEGGFGGDPPPRDERVVDVPSSPEGRRAPDFRIEETTTPEQALLYRLSGDTNPLHADPAFAATAGFEKGPILHGLATYGFMVRHAARGAAGGDASKLTAFEAQFRRPVWPGDTLVTEGWEVSPGRLALSMRVKERDEVVVTKAWAELDR